MVDNLSISTKMINTQYEDLLRNVLENGRAKSDRTGTGTRQMFGAQMRFDLADGFPLITTKKVSFRNIAIELLWLLRGDSNIKWLQDQGCTIWDEWANEDGFLGPVYGVQWRRWPQGTSGTDQIAEVIQSIKTNPNSRRHIVSAWNVSDLPYMALPPCHTLFQFDVTDNKLSCQLYQRSADALLGLPYNIASYSLLTHMIAQQCNLEVGEFVWTGGDVHIYANHVEQVQEQLSREVLPFPGLHIYGHPASIDFYELDDFGIHNYQHHPAISAPVAV